MIIGCALLCDSNHHKRCIREESCGLNIRVIIDKLLIVLILFFCEIKRILFFLLWLNFYPRMNGRWSCCAHLFGPHFDTMVYLVSINQSN